MAFSTCWFYKLLKIHSFKNTVYFLAGIFLNIKYESIIRNKNIKHQWCKKGYIVSGYKKIYYRYTFKIQYVLY